MRNEIRREGVGRIFDKGTALRAAGVGLLVALVSYASAAGAQSRFWLRDDSSNGIRFGTGRLHTSLEFETRYDSFAGWGQSESGGLEEVGDVVLHVKPRLDRKSTRLNSSHVKISYAVFCLKKKKDKNSNNTDAA